MKPSPLAETYLRFVRLTSALEDWPGLEPLDANHKALFEAAVVHWSQDNPLSVQEMIHQAHLGSPATLHKRLQRLIAQGLLSSETLETDRRTKLVRPTDKGMAYAHWAGEQLLRSLN